jgi:hypothetical protein
MRVAAAHVLDGDTLVVGECRIVVTSAEPRADLRERCMYLYLSGRASVREAVRQRAHEWLLTQPEVSEREWSHFTELDHSNAVQLRNDMIVEVVDR